MSHLSVEPDPSADCPPQPARSRATKRSPIRITRCLTRLSDLISVRKAKGGPDTEKPAPSHDPASIWPPGEPCNRPLYGLSSRPGLPKDARRQPATPRAAGQVVKDWTALRHQ